ncbi:MAG: glycosyltransferase [Actinobacteria bacterium]|nr:glycosyltransferase [Actinomycetota bacterium]
MTPAIPLPDRFTGVSVIVPVVTETDSLDETVKILHDAADEWIEQVLIVVCGRTTPESLARCAAARGTFGQRVEIHHQSLPYLGGAIREAFALASASHTIMMSSDLETDPAIVPEMLTLAQANPQAIVTASRWAAGGSFSGYGPHRVALNWIFQRLTSLTYRTHLTDATFGYRLFPTSLLQSIEWEGLRHEFLLETVLKPVRLGVEVLEVPTRWVPRREGESQNSVATQARYIRTLATNRFGPVPLTNTNGKET